MGNAVALIVLYTYPLAVIVMFLRLPRAQAVIGSILLAYLLLPVRLSFNLPMLPRYDRDSAAAYAALFMCLALDRSRPRGAPPLTWLPESPLARFLLLVFLFSPTITALGNGDRIVIGGVVLQGTTLYDGAASFYAQFGAVAPFLLARRYLASAEDQTTTLRAVAVAGLAYSILVVFEARFSPQLHEWVYGYRPFAFGQQIRNDGFRPVVFQQHGLWTAVVTAVALVACAAMWRVSAARARALWMGATVWMAGVLALSNSFGAFALGALLAPAARFLPTRTQALLAAAIGCGVLAYPMMRGLDLIPTRAITGVIAETVDPNRAASLQYRFNNEEILLEHANRRPLFGWGGWNRNRVLDPETGQDLSTTDGRWVITFGKYGWIGFLAEYGLMALSMILLAIRLGRQTASPAATGLTLALALNMIDTIMNGTMTPLTWLLAGAALGHAEALGRRPVAPGVARRPRSALASSSAAGSGAKKKGGLASPPHILNRPDAIRRSDDDGSARRSR